MEAAAAPPPPLVANPRETVDRVELFVVGATIMLFFQLIFGFYRRHSSNMVIQGVWVAYTLSFPLVTYTLGLMRSSPAKSPMYPVWAISLFLVAGCTNSITAYDLDENKQWKKHFFQLPQLYFYAGLIFPLLTPAQFSPDSESYVLQPISVCCYILFGIIMYTNFLRVAACWMANFSDPSKAVGDYMRSRDPVGSAHTDYDPVRMKGYKYLVRWNGYALRTEDAKVANYRNKIGEDIITIDKIWETNGGSQLRDVCLSFSLFHLLKRRFFGIDCYEAACQETRDFVLKGLLVSENGDDNYERAFRVIEVELGFFNDFFFTRYASIFENDIIFFINVVTKIILTPVLGVLVSRRNYSILRASTPIVAVLFHEVVWKVWTCQYLGSTVHFVKLPDILKRDIASSLKSTGNGDLTNGEASLRRHGVDAQFLWTLKREDWNPTDSMLIWHIATNYCEIVLPDPVEGDQQEYRQVATKISKYSTYLMAFLPELLPGSSADTKFTFKKVMEEATMALHPAGPSGQEDRDILVQVIDRPREGQENETIFFKGLTLGMELEGIQGQVPIWKLMAEFWAETILYVAPSNNVRGHIEQLANGGEFMTHLWALLSHAGILTCPKQQNHQGHHV
uniref:Uncharacterized protein n=1 Tax=Avena sativa TaxID=4498 RepID=A0ACD5XIJ8_AVESA